MISVLEPEGPLARMAAMRVLLVSHLFPPAHSAGTELYTAELGQRLAARGCTVTVFTTDKDVGREDLSTRHYRHRGLEVIELVNNLFLEGFHETWDRPEITARFAAVLDELEPDVVHFQHLMYLSVGCLEEARRRGMPVLMTLHDFWLECPRMGQLVHADGGICETVDFARCGTCLPSFEWRQSALARTAGRAIAKLHALTHVDLGPVARGAARWAQAAAPKEWRPPAAAETERFEALARERTRELRERTIASVDRFLSPSRFLVERLVAWGLPAERTFHLPTGVDRAAFAPGPSDGTRDGTRERSRGVKLRVCFLGTLVPLKGEHILLGAWEALDPDLRARGTLTLFGPTEHAPGYAQDLRRRASAVGARLEGALAREEVAAALAATDLLVVPSLWFENRPLVVLEALAARVPLLVSDLGGMAELVEEGVAG
ncbi:MAG: glycosyltransferase, partial [Planctomycetota bacterium]